MKLGEGLSLRARQANELDDLRGRIRANALVQEGDSPAEDPEKLLEKFSEVSEAHAQLVLRISKTNHSVSVEALGGRLLADVLHEREHLRRLRNITESAASAATPRRDAYRYSGSELRFVTSLNVSSLRSEVERYDDETRKLDAIIQEINWSTDLAE